MRGLADSVSPCRREKRRDRVRPPEHSLPSPAATTGDSRQSPCTGLGKRWRAVWRCLVGHRRPASTAPELNRGEADLAELPEKAISGSPVAMSQSSSVPTLSRRRRKRHKMDSGFQRLMEQYGYNQGGTGRGDQSVTPQPPAPNIGLPSDIPSFPAGGHQYPPNYVLPHMSPARPLYPPVYPLALGGYYPYPNMPPNLGGGAPSLEAYVGTQHSFGHVPSGSNTMENISVDEVEETETPIVSGRGTGRGRGRGCGRGKGKGKASVSETAIQLEDDGNDQGGREPSWTKEEDELLISLWLNSSYDWLAEGHIATGSRKKQKYGSNTSPGGHVSIDGDSKEEGSSCPIGRKQAKARLSAGSSPVVECMEKWTVLQKQLAASKLNYYEVMCDVREREAKSRELEARSREIEAEAKREEIRLKREEYETRIMTMDVSSESSDTRAYIEL